MSDLMLDVDQASELKAAFRRGGWTNAEIKRMCEGDNPTLLRRFLNNGCKFVMKGPSTLVIDRANLPTPEKFIGADWSIWRGPADGKGLKGEEDQDPRSLTLTEVDFSKAVFDCPLHKGEQYITGEVKLAREKADSKIRLDFGIAMALFHEKGQATLRFLHDTYGVTWMEFTGTVLRHSSGCRYFLCLPRGDDGSWHWYCRWLDGDRSAARVSVRLAS